MMLLWFWFDLGQFLLPLFPAQLLHKVFFLSHHGVNTQILLKRVDDRHILAKFYHSYLLFPFLSSQRFFSFSGWMKAGSTRYLLPEIKRNSRIWFAVESEHSSLEAYLTMPMYFNYLIWASLQLLSSTAKDPGHLSKCATSFPPCLLHPQHYFNILCSIALLSLSFAIYNYWEYLIE